MRLTFCALCGEDDPTCLEHHHFIPRVHGGTDDETNMFTVCGECHGVIHAVPRPLKLGELIKDGQTRDRSAAELEKIAASRAVKADNAAVRAEEARTEENRERAAKPQSYWQERNTLLARYARRIKAPLVDSIRYTPPSTEIDQMHKDEQFIVSGNWALATDNVQWVLQRRKGDGWEALKFVRSNRDRLAYWLGKFKAPADDTARLLDGLPDSFDGWLQANRKGCHGDLAGSRPSRIGPLPKNVMKRLRRASEPLQMAFGGYVVEPAEVDGLKLYRVRKPDGSVTGPLNLSRAREVARSLENQSLGSAESWPGLTSEAEAAE